MRTHNGCPTKAANRFGGTRVTGCSRMDKQESWYIGSRETLTASLALLIALLAVSGQLRAQQPAQRIALREGTRPSGSTQVRIELKAQGLFRPGLPPGAGTTGARLPKPLALEIQTRLVFVERLVELAQDDPSRLVETDQLALRDRAAAGPRLAAVRQVLQAASAINGEVRPTAATIRPEVTLLVAERRDRDGPVIVACPTGPLTRSELELVEGLGDPLTFGELLPSQPVSVGERWRVGKGAVESVSGYDVIASSDLEASLESVDSGQARLRLKGRVQGSALGGTGTITLDGFFTFDRQAARIDRLEIHRVEVRQPGPIEAGLEVKSSLSVTRQTVVPPATLSDAALHGVPLTITPQREQLQLVLPGGKATVLHDRHWHIFWEDPKLMVLKRLDGEQVIAQANFAQGPAAGKARHQDPRQFCDDIRRALKQRFVRFLGAGEVDGDPAGGFRYKVAVLGRELDLDVVWYYYLLASPEGDQLLATFTLAADRAGAFDNQDLGMIGSLRWTSSSAAQIISREGIEPGSSNGRR
jgi:hypothetical protein